MSDPRALHVRITPRIYKNGFLLTLVFVVGQQIYYPQPQKYFHLALLFAYMAFNDMRSHEYRDLGCDVLFLISTVLTSVISIVGHLVISDLALLYRFFLGVSGFLAIKSFLDLRSIVHKRRTEYIADNHHRIFRRSTRFLEFLLIGVSAVIVVATAYVISRTLL